mmetsp:Transcript_88425/g.249169  ORF Transcript_88425/g.249169 Transcript_88425/m.249169 type:complete len:289 (-) Transcript_88425:272-1138(-)
MADCLTVVLVDSLMADEYAPDGVRYERWRDAGESFQVCSIIQSGASLMMPGALRGELYHNSILSLAKRVLSGSDKKLQRFVKHDPAVNVIAFNCAGMINDCRKGEQYPQVVEDRRRSPLIVKHETEYTMLDFEDVVQQRKDRKRFADLERCRFRHKPGLYGKDRFHVKRKVRKPACRELVKAIRRTAISRYGKSKILLVILAGGNVEGATYSHLDCFGKAWRRAEVLASTELCALHGHPASAFSSKMEELCSFRRGNHRRLLKMPIRTIAKPVLRKVRRKGHRNMKKV